MLYNVNKNNALDTRTQTNIFISNFLKINLDTKNQNRTHGHKTLFYKIIQKYS